MKRDHVIVLAIIAVVAVLAFSKRVVTSQTILLFAVAVPSIILHEISHGVVALTFGDDTAKKAGRLTLNPVRHIDLFGTIILPALLALSGSGVFGFAKPVPINPSRMRNPRDNALVVSLAGPATNLVLAAVAGGWLSVKLHAYRGVLGLDTGPWGLRIPLALGLINVVLAVFNLIPIPPLDGSAVLGRFIPGPWRHGWEQLQRYGLLILLAMVFWFRGGLSRLLNPAVNLWLRLVAP